MSFLVGPVSGALVAGGVYYGFSTLIQTRTEKHRTDLHTLSVRLLDASAHIPAPPPASQRIEQQAFLSMIKSKWNDQIANLFRGIGGLDDRATEWGRRVLYGGDDVTTRRA